MTREALRRPLTLLTVALLAAACGSTTTTSPQPTSSPSNAATAKPTPSPITTSRPTDQPSTAGPTGSATQPATTPSGARTFNVALSAEFLVSRLPPLILVTNAGDGSGLLYAVAQTGVIYVVDRGFVLEQPFLDIANRLVSGGEQGLLGLAFHPDYASNGRFFVDYTRQPDGATVISEFARSSSEPGLVTADPASERILLTISQPFANHNGGMLAFGPDGYLYIGMGDGGSGGDPNGNGQNLGTLLGKMLRIDVDSGDPYLVPPDNPFLGLGADGVLPEIWSYGLRNPWRYSFDSQTGALFIGDVGQNAEEEIDVEPAGDGGRNYGWNVMEGELCYRPDPCDSTGMTPPVAVNDRQHGECAITGGYVYRGTQYPDLFGAYLFSDYCAGTLWAFDADAAIATGHADVYELGSTGISPSSFGEDEAGELYVVDLEGDIYRLVATAR